MANEPRAVFKSRRRPVWLPTSAHFSVLSCYSSFVSCLLYSRYTCWRMACLGIGVQNTAFDRVGTWPYRTSKRLLRTWLNRCRHSIRLRAWSTSSLLIFLQNTRCSTHAYHSRRQKLRCRRTALASGTLRQMSDDRPACDITHLFRLEVAVHCDF